MRAEPHNTLVALYLANCYYSTKQVFSAKQYYSWIATNYPLSSEAQQANSMLARISPAGSTDSASTTSATTSSAFDGKVDVDKMIRVVKPQADHPGCSDEFINQIKTELKGFPKKLLAFAAANDCVICVTPSLIDRNPELRNSKPRGYEDGLTYKNTPAMFDGREIVVCQYAVVGENDENVKLMDDSIGSLRHEFGHALDHYLGRVTAHEKFKHMYDLDAAQAQKSEDAAQLQYYIRSSSQRGGASECFAEACAIALGGRKAGTAKDKRDEAFERNFPNVMEFAKKLVQTMDK
jgi:hypothetical protein